MEGEYKAKEIRGILMEMRDEGYTLKDIGEIIGVSRQRIGQIVGKTGFAQKKYIDSIIGSFPDHMSAAEIARQTGFGYTTVLNYREIEKDDQRKALFYKNRIVHESGCWEIHGANNAHGMQRFGYAGKIHFTNRLMWEFERGEKLGRDRLYNRCGNSWCCNPDHWQK